MACYYDSCSGEPKYVCKTCGGMVCDQHGERIDGQNKSFCYNCVSPVTAATALAMVSYLSILSNIALKDPKYSGLSKEQLRRLARYDFPELENKLKYLVQILNIRSRSTGLDEEI